MKKRSIAVYAFVFSVLILIFTTTVYAKPLFNDDADTFSYTKYLPVMTGGALIIESLAIIIFTDIKRIVNVSFAVLIANIVSFLIPRFVLGLIKGTVFYTGMYMIANTPKNWLLICIILAVSLAVELPVIWFSLRGFTNKKGRLMLVAAAANIVTVFTTAFIEIQINNWLLS